ncbi:hypothetical protein GQ44DRAFT_783020 [Phaeosphaeriaceae sp. PMI808]|nr:hypothetical protein GQ44DRAFT_783020 [Phaeosphaeriaceae sp. PMI808]
MTVFDELAETDGDNEFKAWLSMVIDAKQEIVKFVASQRQGNQVGEFDGYLKGSFNLSLVVRFSDGGPKAVIRFPKPGHTATTFQDEKVRNEVQFLKFLSEKTTIPVPRVHLGPFIIMDYVDAISKIPSSDEWIASERPLTYNTNELQTVVSNYSINGYPTTPFTSAKAFLYSLTDEHLIHFQTQRNLANNREDAKKRFIARHRFKQLISRYCIDDTGPFKPYCDDLQPSNMLADPDTLRITAVLDFEFTNAMPVQFAYDPPWWLLLLGPDMWLEHHSIEGFTTRYVPRMEQFLRTMERAEARTFRKSFDVYAVYWAALHKDGDDVIDDSMREEMEKLVNLKMDQLKAYDAECKVRFSSWDLVSVG